MSDTLKLALTITAVDLFSGVLRRMGGRIQGAGAEAQRVRRDFDLMTRSVGQGVKAIAVAGYVAAKLRPGVRAASDLQAEMLGAQAEMSHAGTSAATLAKQLAAVRSTAFGVQAWTPFDMTQIVAMEKELIKAGARVSDIVGKHGAAAATAALATYEKMDPTTTGNALIGIGTPFKVQASGYMQLADDISRAASASTVGAADIAESAKYAAGPLAALHKAPKEMLALVAVMAQVGVTGSMAGTSLRRFFMMAARHKEFRKANGDIKSTAEIIEVLRKQLHGMGAAQQSALLTKVFGPQGAPVALALLNKGKGSFGDILRQMDQAAPLAEKLKIQMEGFGKQMESLQGTSKSTIAELFQPALRPLTAIVKKTNELTAALGTAAQHHEALGRAVTYGGAALVGAGVAYGGYKLLRGGLAGMRVLKGLKGLGGAAGGIAAGKAVQAATGVAPVFITNWPAGFGAAGAGAGGGAIREVTQIAKKVPGVAAGGVAIPAIAAGVATGGLIYAGYKATHNAGARAYGKAQQEGIDSYRAKTARMAELAKKGIYAPGTIGHTWQSIEAFFGDKAAKAALAASERAYRAHPQELNGTIKIEVQSKDTPVRVREAKVDRPGVNIQTDTAAAGVGGW